MASILPVGLNIEKMKIAFIGSGQLCIRRLKLINEAGINNVTLFNPHNITEEIVHLSGGRCINRMPSEDEIKNYSLFMIAGIEDQQAFKLAELVRSYGKLVNVEDRKEYCDFYYSSIVRRGDLVIGVNTGGKSPALSKRIREFLEEVFPLCWKDRLEALSEKRRSWKAEGCLFNDVMKKSYDFIDQQNWFVSNPLKK